MYSSCRYPTLCIFMCAHACAPTHPHSHTPDNSVFEAKPTLPGEDHLLVLNIKKYVCIMFLENSHLLPGDLTHPCSSFFSHICRWSARSASVHNTSSLGPVHRGSIVFPSQRMGTCLPSGLALGFRSPRLGEIFPEFAGEVCL